MLHDSPQSNDSNTALIICIFHKRQVHAILGDAKTNEMMRNVISMVISSNESFYQNVHNFYARDFCAILMFSSDLRSDEAVVSDLV